MLYYLLSIFNVKHITGNREKSGALGTKRVAFAVKKHPTVVSLIRSSGLISLTVNDGQARNNNDASKGNEGPLSK